MSAKSPNPVEIARRWSPGVAIPLVAALLLFAIHTESFTITGKPSRDMLCIIAISELGFYLWVRIFSGLNFKRQIGTIAAFCAFQAAMYSMIRLDGFTGDGRPVWTWRWIPTPEISLRRRLSSATAPARQQAAALGTAGPSDYPGFRGRDRTGIIKDVQLEIDWNRFPPKLLWRQAIGRGWSSFAIVGEYCFTQEQRDENEVVVCYHVRTGVEVWIHRDPVAFNESTGGSGPRATPTFEGGRIYTLGATGILNSLDASTGQRLWSVNVLDDIQSPNAIFGMAGSPLVFDSVVVTSPGGIHASLVAYDLISGTRTWRSGSSTASYSSPAYSMVAGRKHILNFNGDGLFGHDANTGQVLWSYPWVSNPAERNNVCQPVVLQAPDSQSSDVLISSGYGMGSACIEVNQAEGQFSVRERWQSKSLKAKFSSLVVRDGYAFGMDGAILTCIDLRNGEQKWKGGRYGYGQLLLVDSILLVQSETGEIALVDATPHGHHEFARTNALSSRTWNHPALAGQILLVRNDREAACYELATPRGFVSH